MNEQEDDFGKNYNNEIGLGGNLVQEGNTMNEGEEGHNPNDQQFLTNDYTTQPVDDNSFHVNECIEKIHQNPKFTEKEKQFSQKVDDFMKSKIGKPLSFLSGYIFFVNKILMFISFSEFYFQRFDIITLFLCFVIILIEIGVFSHKHMYKWLLVLLISLLMDAFVLLDISPVSKK